MTELVINNITGSTAPPYSGYACDVYGNQCVYIGEITGTPQTIILPSPQFDSAPAIGFKLVESIGCEIFGILYCVELPPEGKQFQDGEYFLFMDYTLYQFN